MPFQSVKRKSNEEQYKMNTKVMLKLDEAEQAVDTTKTKEKIIEGTFCSKKC